MATQKEFETLLGQYMMANPQAENPMSYFQVFGLDGLVELLQKANGKRIEFFIDETIIDGIIPTIDGIPVN